MDSDQIYKILNRFKTVNLKSDFSFVTQEDTLKFVDQVLDRKNEDKSIAEFFPKSSPELIEIL